MRDGLTVDKWMLLAVVGLLAVGVTMVLSTSYLYSQERYGDGTYFFRKQMIAMGAGAVALIACTMIPSALYRRFAYPLLALSFIILVLVLVPGVGVNRGGARRWIMFPGFAFQPSELAKLALVFYLAHSMAKKEQMIRSFSVGVLPHLMVFGLFAGMLLLEPDFGTALMLSMLLYFMLFIGGARVHHLVGTGLMALPVLIYVFTKADYRIRRLMSFLDPWSDAAGSGFHVIQSLIAFGSGQIWGRGLGESRQKLFYLPEAHTDFVFSVIGEELGLLGALAVLALFGVIITRGLQLTAKIEEPFDQYLAFGLTVLLGLQALIHMGVVMGLMPTKGLVLPFISYGGSAMVINLMEAGILLGLSRRRL
ncbi:MAG TPA: putative lipid II flippase FtsW [Candidatus Eisenbacteria bacterium]|jgi:cell division protein FtsW|nr:putative lipid II flippase FtsW [Candidatus Eisenbacteria bacterium]